MTYQQTQLLTTLRVMIASMDVNSFRTALEFQLDWLEKSIDRDHSDIKDLQSEINGLLGESASHKLNWQIEEKWRKELQAKNLAAEAENTWLHGQLHDVTEAYEEEMDAAEFEHFTPVSGRVHDWDEVRIVRKTAMTMTRQPATHTKL